MAKSASKKPTAKKAAQKKKPVALELPPGPAYQWPESREPRQLFVDLKPEELAVASRLLAETVPHINSLEEAAKASAAQHKVGIQAVHVEQSRLSGLVTQKKEERKVDCAWIYECAGTDSQSGDKILHPEKKTLFRLDTGAAVEIRDIANEERQMSLIPEDKPDGETAEGEEIQY